MRRHNGLRHWWPLLTVGLTLGPLTTPPVAHAQRRLVPSPLPGIYHTIHLASQEFGVPGDFLVCIAARESGLRPWVMGDQGRAAGLWQFHRGTFRLAARLAGYPPQVARDWPRQAQDVTVSVRAAAALMRAPRLGGRWHWSTAGACGRWWQ